MTPNFTETMERVGLNVVFDEEGPRFYRPVYWLDDDHEGAPRAYLSLYGCFKDLDRYVTSLDPYGDKVAAGYRVLTEDAARRLGLTLIY